MVTSIFTKGGRNEGSIHLFLFLFFLSVFSLRVSLVKVVTRSSSITEYYSALGSTPYPHLGFAILLQGLINIASFSAENVVRKQKALYELPLQ